MNFGDTKDIVQIGYVALQATKLTIGLKYNELSSRFSKRFLDSTQALTDKYIIDRDDLKKNYPDIEFVELGEAGIFGGLWELAEVNDTGLKVYLHDILIRQETIEILELFDANPYTYPSEGTYTAAVSDGYKFVKNLTESGLAAAVIGQTTNSNDRIVLNGEDMRYLTPIDRLYKDEQEININGTALRKELSDARKDIKLH